MSAVLTAPLPALTLLHRKRWTSDECDRLEGQGVLPEKYELLDGEIIDKMGQHLPHTFGVTELIFYLRGITQTKQVINQATILVAPEDAPHNRPEPDVAVLARAGASLLPSSPGAADLLLVAEVSDTTLADDLAYKAGLYARAGIPEYWVLDINGRQVIVHKTPISGRYTSIVVHDEGSRIAPDFAPGRSILVGDLL